MKFMTLNRKVALAGIGGVVVGGVVAWFLLAPATKIVLMHVPKGATVYLDNTVAVERSASGRIVLSDLPPGEHTVLVAGDKLWPWAKTVTLGEDESAQFGVTALAAQGASLQPVAKDALSETGAESALRARMRAVPSADEPVLSQDKHVALWADGETIKAKWLGSVRSRPEYFCTPQCADEIVVLPSEVKIRSLSFLGDRNDVALFAAENSIFAIELDRRGTQNFQPIYKGTAPLFSPDAAPYCSGNCSEDALVIYDTENGEGAFSILELP